MRKFFGGTIIVSLLAAGLIGAALAWTGSQTGGIDNGAVAGQVCVNFFDEGTVANPVVPNGGWTQVYKGGLDNCGDVDVHVKSGLDAGTVTGISYDLGCGGSAHTTGRVQRLANTSVVVGGGGISDLWSVELNADADLPDSCQNSNIDFTVTINVTT
jgi:hypothetical protein